MTMKWLSCMLLFSALISAEAQTINATSCSSTDVQTAFNSITSLTTTVNIPAGTCHWTTHVVLTVPSGSATLSILGAGNLNVTGGGDATVIIDDYTTDSALLMLTPVSSSLFRVAGITIKGGSGVIKDHGVVTVAEAGATNNFRWDHDHFDVSTYTSAPNMSAMEVDGCVNGVVDHNIFDAVYNSVSNAIRVYNGGPCYGDPGTFGDQVWAHSTGLGTNSFLFAEDNIFNFGFANDCLSGGRQVFRYNTLNTVTVQEHPTGAGSANRYRGCRAFEIYNNTMPSNDGGVNTPIYIDSGTGVIWGNSAAPSGYKNFIVGHETRSDSSAYPQTAAPNGWGYCGTNFNGTGTNWDENAPSTTGYACLDQLGRGVGDLLANDFPNVTNATLGCTSSTQCWPRQALEPIYEWMDSWSGSGGGSFWNQANGSSVIQNNQDYYLWCNASSASGCKSFNGTAGVGSGLLSGRPSTCTLNVAYWATDTSTLYQCSAANTWTVYYTPYTYPHPLTLGSGPPPNPPQNLQANVD
jgi:hypothetical protein